MLITHAKFEKDFEEAVSKSKELCTNFGTVVDAFAASSSSDETIQKLYNNISVELSALPAEFCPDRLTQFVTVFGYMNRLVRSGFIKNTSQNISADTLTQAQFDVEERWAELTKMAADLLIQFGEATGDLRNVLSVLRVRSEGHQD